MMVSDAVPVAIAPMNTLPVVVNLDIVVVASVEVAALNVPVMVVLPEVSVASVEVPATNCPALVNVEAKLVVVALVVVEFVPVKF